MRQFGAALSIRMFSCLILLAALTAKADYEGVTAKTNVNQQTDLFEKSIDDHKSLEQQIEQDKQSAVSGLKKNPQGLEYISTKSASEISAEVAQLEAIKPNDLNGRGREEIIKRQDDIDLEDLYPDFNKPLNIQHQEDAEKIAAASDDLLVDLLKKLKDLGMDCKTIAGNKIMEPEYTIKIEQELTRKKGETLYDQAICEEPRKEYNCTDSVKLTCKKQVSLSMGDSKFTSNLPVVTQTSTGYLQLGFGSTMKGGKGTEFNYEICFEIDELKGVQEFILKDVFWDDHIHITLNDQRIFAGPVGGEKLELLNHDFKGIVIVDSSGQAYSAEYNTWHQTWPNIDLQPYLKEGKNVIKIRLIVAGHGGILIGFQTVIQGGCAEWSEDWTERCKIR